MSDTVRKAYLSIEFLEDRTTPATFSVTNLNDSGAGSLRDAITQANAAPDADTIVFAGTAIGGTINLATFTNLLASTPAVPQPAGPSAFLITGPLSIDGAGETLFRSVVTPFRLFQVTAGGSLSLRNLTLSNGLAQGFSGGFATTGEAGGGAAGLGGAVYNQGTVTFTDCLLMGNQAVGGTDEGGAISGGGGGGGLAGPPGFHDAGGPPNTDRGFGSGGRGGDSDPQENGGFGGGGGGGLGFPGGSGGFGGGGGAGDGSAGGTGGGGVGFGGNNGSPKSGGGGSGFGGAVFNQGGTIFLTNSTVTGNTAKGGNANDTAVHGGGFGGGVFNLNGTVTLSGATIAGNAVASGIGRSDFPAEGTELVTASIDVGTVTPTQTARVNIANSILAQTGVGLNAVVNLAPPTFPLFSTINATGPNILFGVQETFGTFTGTPFTVANPNLGPLQNNGGFTFTLAPSAGSPAINAGSSTSAIGLTDQRGTWFSRDEDGGVDLGAFEVQSPVVVTPTILPAGQFGVAYNQTITASGPPGQFSFAVTSGSLPPGLNLDGSGNLIGTQVTAGTFHFTVTATNGVGEFGSQAYTLDFTPPPARPITVGGLFNGTGLAFTPSGGQFQTGSTLTFFADAAICIRTATADVNGDGTPDYIGGTGPGFGTQVVVLDGKTGAPIASFSPFEASFTGGVFVAAADINGDGKAEVVVTPDQGGGPIAAVYDGAKLTAGAGDAAQIVRFFGIEDPNFRGGARPALGDVNGDGRADLVVSAGFLGGPRIAIFDGKSIGTAAPTHLIGDFFAFEDTLRNGAFVAVGDVNGDGHADITFGAGPGGAPRVRVFDGAKLVTAGSFSNLNTIAKTAQLDNFFAGDTSLRGGVRLAMPDVNGDGTAALVTGSGEGEPGLVGVFVSTNLLSNANPVADQVLDPFGDTILANGVFVG